MTPPMANPFEMLPGMAPGLGGMTGVEPGRNMTPSQVPQSLMTPEEVVRVVDRMEQERSLLHTRMDQDYSRWRGDPYTGDEALDGYAKFTSNDARTFADWLIGEITGAVPTVRIHAGDAQREERRMDTMKEMFVLGQWQAVDERRTRLLQPKLVNGMTWQAGIRGRRAQRVLFIKEIDPDPPPLDQSLAGGMGMQGGVNARPDPMSAMALEGGPGSPPPESAGSLPPELMQMMALVPGAPPPTRTYADVQDWDPRNTYWAMGQHGLAWACHKSKVTTDEIIAEFGVDPANLEGPITGPPQATGEARRDWWRYEWFDDKVGMVMIDGARLLKPPTPHGMTRVPVCLGFVGSLPPVQENGQVNEEDYGDSIYHAARDIYDENNHMMSVMKELSHRAINQSHVWKSASGQVPDENTRLTGSDIAIGPNDDVKLLPPMEMVRETAAFMGIIAAMKQRGSVTDIAFGNPDFQLSGYAINSLRQGIMLAIKPPLQCVIEGLGEIFNLFCDAYATGAFDTMTLSGQTQGNRRRYFRETITPDVVAQGGILEIDLIPQLPTDDAAKATVAQMLREDTGSGPLVDNRYLRENVLDIQDVDLMERAVLEQMAQTASPVALAFKMMMSAAEQGDRELAEIWSSQLQIQMMQQFLEMMQLQFMGAPPPGGEQGGPPAPGGGNGSGRGARPAAGVLPGQAQGIPQGRPTPQQGPLVPPGTPRPNARGSPGVPPVVQAWSQ